jgi:hypothetical protein
MTVFLVEHRWKPSSKSTVKQILSDVIEKAASNGVASGMQLLSVVISQEDSCAECI